METQKKKKILLSLIYEFEKKNESDLKYTDKIWTFLKWRLEKRYEREGEKISCSNINGRSKITQQEPHTTLLYSNHFEHKMFTFMAFHICKVKFI